MSSFWDDAERPNDGTFELMEHNTLVLAVIKGVETKSAFAISEKPEPDMFQLTWQILQGRYTNRRIWQSLEVYSSDKKKAANKKGKLLRILEVANEPRPESPPLLSHLFPLQGKIMKILIQVFKGDQREVNFVANVFPQDYEGKQSSSRSIADADAEPPFNDNIPF